MRVMQTNSKKQKSKMMAWFLFCVKEADPLSLNPVLVRSHLLAKESKK